jgi:plasmid stability protein
MVQIRNVPVDLHQQLKVRAAMEGLSMSEFILREIRRALEHPPRREIIERLRSRPVRRLRRSAAEVVRAEREGR